MFLGLLLANTIDNSRSPAKFVHSNISRDSKDGYLKQVEGIINNCISKKCISDERRLLWRTIGLLILILKNNTQLKR